MKTFTILLLVWGKIFTLLTQIKCFNNLTSPDCVLLTQTIIISNALIYLITCGGKND